jgi:hypothetical protein
MEKNKYEQLLEVCEHFGFESPELFREHYESEVERVNALLYDLRKEKNTSPDKYRLLQFRTMCLDILKFIEEAV